MDRADVLQKQFEAIEDELNGIKNGLRKTLDYVPPKYEIPLPKNTSSNKPPVKSPAKTPAKTNVSVSFI